ncbi:MAG: Holliday junction resolvase RuvX [Gemmatimonas sp.]|nr:Holliday junction resolvase RuvX [Gemmatimonas sp.]
MTSAVSSPAAQTPSSRSSSACSSDPPTPRPSPTSADTNAARLVPDSPLSMTRVLAVDYGGRRIGVALSDPTRTIAAPLTTLTRRRGKRPPWAELERLVREHEVAEIVVGLPLDLGGNESEWSEEVREFAAKLGRRVERPVHLVDERLTSVQAERVVRGIGLRRTQREEKERVDAAAAAVILMTYLAGQKRGEDGVSS